LENNRSDLLANRAATASVLSVAQPAEDRRDLETERLERQERHEREREERRQRDEEKEFRNQERDWERREGDKARDKSRESDRKAGEEGERAKRAEAARVKPEPEEFKQWWDKYHDRILPGRRRARQREAEDDDNDRRREKEELDEAGKEAKKQAAQADEQSAAEAECLQESEAKKELAGPVTFGLGGGKRKNAVQFDGDEEGKKMKFTPIEYTDEEQAARELVAKKALPERTPEEKEAEMKRLIATIPTGKDALLAYDVDWLPIEKGGLIEKKMRPWVTKKIADYLGEEEPMLIKYVLEMLAEKEAANDVIEKLGAVLEPDEAETFVIKLWRYLIFESMRFQAGLL